MSIVALLLLIIIAAGIILRNPIKTAFTVKQISNNPAFYCKASGNLYFDDFLNSDGYTSEDATRYLYKRLSLGIYNPSKNQNCSGFYAVTPEGDYILGNNIEIPDLEMFRVPCVMESEINKHTIGLCNMGNVIDLRDGLDIFDKIKFYAMPYYIDGGVNEDGLGIAVASVRNARSAYNENKKYIDSAMMTNAVLNHASTVDEAVEYMEQWNVAGKYFICHFLLGDKDGKCAVVEYNNGEMEVFYPENGQEYMAMSNCMQANPIGYGADRFESYYKSLGECKGVVSMEKAFDLLEQNSLESEKMWSVVFNLSKKTLNVKFFNDPEKIYTYSLS